jgi:hypothetical protein
MNLTKEVRDLHTEKLQNIVERTLKFLCSWEGHTVVNMSVLQSYPYQNSNN